MPSLTLPKGGGAIRGIGEKFATSAPTGTGALSVPIATSPGRAGFQFGLALHYDSGAGNGPFRLGWHLSTPAVTRKTDKGLPRYANDESEDQDRDVFILSSVEDLVPLRVPDGAGTRLDVALRGDYRVQRYRNPSPHQGRNGTRKLDPPALLRALPSPAELGGGVQQLTDLGADGNLDLVQYTPPLSGYFERTPGRTFAPFVPLSQLPNIDWNDPNLRFLDIDGDGLADVLITENDAFVWYRSRGKDGFESGGVAPHSKDELKGPAVIFSDGSETIQLTDMSGDGLVDIVRGFARARSATGPISATVVSAGA